MSRIVEETLVEVIEPIVFEEALELIRAHRAAGRRVFIVSASPEEVVAPLGRYLGVDESIGTRAEIDDQGRYTGRTERYCYGPEKVAAIVGGGGAPRHRPGGLVRLQRLGQRPPDAGGRSATRWPSTPIASCCASARRHGWEVCRFARKVPLRERVPMPAPRHAASGGGAVALAVGAGIVARWLSMRQSATALRRFPAVGPW